MTTLALMSFEVVAKGRAHKVQEPCDILKVEDHVLPLLGRCSMRAGNRAWAVWAAWAAWQRYM